MSIPSGKKILLVGFVIVLLIAIPITVYLVQQQQKTRSSAVAATVLSLAPTSQSTTVGTDVNLDVNLDPSINLVSFVKVLISYDATKLATDSAGFVPNAVAFPSVLQPPTYGPGTISFTLSIGGSPQNAIQKPTKVGTITFKAIGATDAAPTQITFGNQTQVLSIGSTDQFNENVLSTTSPASIIITAPANITPSLTPTDTPVPTATLIPTATPTLTPTSTPAPGVTITPTDTPIPGVTSAPTATPSPTVIAAGGPICSSLTLDRSSNGVAPYNVNLTANGNSSTSTISKVTFTFGDGQTQDVTDSGGVGTSSISTLISHVFTTAGSFTATATLTDANGLVSSGGCSVLVTVSGGASPTEIAAIPSVSPLPATGPANIVSIGIIGLVLTLIGAVLVFAL